MSLANTAYFANGFAVGGMMSIACTYCGAIACYGQELGHRYGCPELQKIGCVDAQTVTTSKDFYSKSEVKIKTTRYITEEEFDDLRRRNAEVERLRNAARAVVKQTWDVKRLSSDQCEAIDGIEAALKEVDDD